MGPAGCQDGCWGACLWLANAQSPAHTSTRSSAQTNNETLFPPSAKAGPHAPSHKLHPTRQSSAWLTPASRQVSHSTR